MADKRQKTRSLEEMKQKSSHDQIQEVAELEAELRYRDVELTKLQTGVRQRREAAARGEGSTAAAGPSRSDTLLTKAADMRYNHMQEELDALKL